MTDPYTPQAEHHFTFGLWTVGNRGRDPVRPRGAPAARSGRGGAPPRRARRLRRELPRRRPRAVRLVAAEREAILKRFRQALDETGMKVPMATTNLFCQPGVQGGRVHRQRPARPPVRGAPRRSTPSTSAPSSGADGLRDVGRPRGRGGRRGQGRARRARPLRGGGRPLLRATSASAATTCVIALEPKPNEPRGDMFLPTVGHALAFIERARVARHGRAQPRVRPRDDVGADVHPRGRPDAVAREALPHRPQRPAHRQVRPGLPLRLRGHPRRLLPREAARGLGLGRACATSTPTPTAPRTPTACGTSPVAACAPT